MEKIEFTVEKTGTGYSAYANPRDGGIIATTGGTIAELKNNMLDAANTFLDYEKRPLATENDLFITLDIPQFFEYYKEVNASALSKRIGMNKTLLSQYINGQKKPSPKQTNRILEGIRELGNELSKLELAY